MNDSPSVGGGPVHPLSLLLAKQSTYKRNEVRNACENHEVGFHCGVAYGASVLALCGELPTPAGVRGVCGRHLRCPAGDPGEKVLLVGRICCDCSAIQSDGARS